MEFPAYVFRVGAWGEVFLLGRSYDSLDLFQCLTNVVVGKAPSGGDIPHRDALKEVVPGNDHIQLCELPALAQAGYV